MSEQWRKLVVEFVRAAVLLDPVLHLDLVALLQTRASAPEPSPSPAPAAPVPEPAGRDEGSNSSQLPAHVDVTADGLSQLSRDLRQVGVVVDLIEMATWPEMRHIVAREWLKQGAKPTERPDWLPEVKKPIDLLGLLRANVAAAKNSAEIAARPPPEKKKRGKKTEERQPDLFDADENVISACPED